MNKKQLGLEGEAEDELPEWEVVVEEPFSDEVVCKAVEKWLGGRGYEFGVRMIDYDGFYGSVVADVESDRLLGKIEGIDGDIVYFMKVGQTVRECEQRFREAVSRYKKK